MNKALNKPIFGILKSQNAVINLTKLRNSVGRSKTSTIIINHPSVSKDHALIEFDNEQNCTIKDLNSSNGTYVNGAKLQFSPYILQTNDKISFGKDPIEYIFESFNNENEKTEIYPTIRDAKISLVNENEYQAPRINHLNARTNQYFQNEVIMGNMGNNLNLNPNNTNNNLNTNNTNNHSNNNNNFNTNTNFNTNNNFNSNNYLDSPQFGSNNQNIIKENIIPNEENDLNDNMTFKNKSEEFTKQIQNLTDEKEEMMKKIAEYEQKLSDKEKETKKINDLFDQLSEEYSKLKAKHNALIIYASDLQKKVDILEIEQKDREDDIKNKDFTKVLKEKDNIIRIFQNETNFYKEQLNTIKSNQNFQFQPMQISPYNTISQYQDVSQIEKRLNDLIDNYIEENRKLKEKVETQKKEIAEIHRNNNIIDIESQLNIQIDNFNSIISDYNAKYNEAVSKIPLMFQNEKKEEAAKFLVEQVNIFMDDNQKLIKENAQLKSQISQMEKDLTDYKGKAIKSNYLQTFEEDKEQDNDQFQSLKNRVEELENIISRLKSTRESFTGGMNQMNKMQMIGMGTNRTFPFNNNNNEMNMNVNGNMTGNVIGNVDNNEMKECLVNALNEVKEKEKIIDDLKSKLKETINKNQINFDERQIVTSMSNALREKDNLIKKLQNEINDKKNDMMMNQSENAMNQIGEIRMKKKNVLNSLYQQQ